MGFSSFGAVLEAVGTAASAATTGLGIANAISGAKLAKIAIPPPPGAAMIDPSGSAAAAATRQRQAAAGGLGSTQTAAGQTAATGVTSGAKALLGQ